MSIDSDEEERQKAALKMQKIQDMMGRLNQTEEELKDQVASSGYKILKAKESLEGNNKKEQSNLPVRYSKRILKEQEEKKQIEPEELDVKVVPLTEAEREITREKMTGQDAMFALIAIRMMKLSQKYNKKLYELHHLFYTVSCDWESLEALLQEQKIETMEMDHPSNIVTWTLLEDLAARDCTNGEAFKHIVEEKGLEEVKKRRMFLEIN